MYKDEIDVVKPITILVLVLVGVIVLFNSFYIIGAGYRGVLLTFGKANMVSIDEGLHFKIPMVQSVVKMEIRTLKYEADLTAASRDLQDVNTKIAINYHLTPIMVPSVFRDLGINYAERVIQPLEQETNKAITSQFTAEELITKRDEVRQKMKDSLKEKLESRGIVVEEVSIINFQFSPSFSAAIETKVTAEQNALAAKNKLEQIKYEAQQTEAAAIGQKNAAIAAAQGNAEAVRLNAMANADAIKLIDEQLKRSTNYIDYYKLQKWDGVLPKVTGGAVPFVDIQKIG